MNFWITLFFVLYFGFTLAQDSNAITLATWNIQIFGATKASRPEVLDVIATVLSQYDIVFIQELRETPTDECGPNTNPSICQLNSLLQSRTPDRYALIVGDRVGRLSTSVREQYAVFYDQSRFQVIDPAPFTYVESNPDLFIREPYIVHFQEIASGVTFVTANIHTEPDGAQAEILVGIPELIQTLLPIDENAIVLGDFNADGTFFNEANDWPVFFQTVGPGWTNLIDDSLDSTVAEGPSNVNTYDRILASPAFTASLYVPGSQQIFYFNSSVILADVLTGGCAGPDIYLTCPNPTLEEATGAVSDHYPAAVQLLFPAPAATSAASLVLPPLQTAVFAFFLYFFSF